MKETDKFTYWKYPWCQWLVLGAAFLQIVALWLKLWEFRAVLAAGIYTSGPLVLYIMEQKFGFLCHSVAGLLLLGLFLIGNFIHSRREARRTEAMLLLIAAVSLSAGLYAWHEAIRGLWVWGILLAAAYAVGVAAFFRSAGDS